MGKWEIDVELESYCHFACVRESHLCCESSDQRKTRRHLKCQPSEKSNRFVEYESSLKMGNFSKTEYR